MPKNVAVPYLEIGKDLTFEPTGAALVGMTFAEFAGGDRPSDLKGKTATEGAKPAGVVAHDCPVGGHVLIYRGGIVPVRAGADIPFNTQVEVGPNGTAIPLATGIAVGIAVTNGTNGGEVAVSLSL